MPDPISIATLSILAGLTIYKIGKIILKIKSRQIISSCCGEVNINRSRNPSGSSENTNVPPRNREETLTNSSELDKS